jgi:hypothetical protein
VQFDRLGAGIPDVALLPTPAFIPEESATGNAKLQEAFEMGKTGVTRVKRN